MGLGGHLPFELSRRVIPRLPQHLQRFTPAESWAAAEASSIGYSRLPVAPRTRAHETTSLLTGNRASLVAAFGVALSSIPNSNKPIRVVDFGGYDGKHADLIMAAFPRLKFDWTVVDLPSVVESMSRWRNSEMKFTTDLDSALSEAADVILASASLQYVHDPQAVMETFCHRSAAVILSRLPLWPISEHCVAVQHSERRPSKVSYPAWFFSEKLFISELPAGSEIVLDLICPDDRAAFTGLYLKYRCLVIETDLLNPAIQT